MFWRITASTMTQAQETSPLPPLIGVGGSPFNLVDVARAYNANFTLADLSVTQTAGTGFLAVFEDGIPWAGHSNINWYAPNQVVANNATTGFSIAGDFRVRCGTTGSTHFVVDALGFYTLTA